MSGATPRLAAACVALLLAAACSGGGDDTAGADGSSTSTAADAASADDDTEVGSEDGAAPAGDEAVSDETVVLNAAPPVATGTRFEEGFDGAPGAPTPWESANWDVTVHSRDKKGDSIDPMTAMHGMDCAGPPAEHPVELYSQTVFLCKDHLMTSLNAEGYGAIYLTPDHLVDFSAGEAVVSFQVSTLRSSTRDWWDLWITPYEEHTQLPGEDWYPDLNGPPQDAIHINMADFNSGETGFIGEVFRDFQKAEIPGDLFTSMETVLTPDAARRDRFELRISGDHIKFGMPEYDLWWLDTSIADLGWDQGVVQFGHHSYNPTKEGGLPGTWHWDGVIIEPSVPFVIEHPDRRAVGAAGSTEVSFADPAPSDAMLRFAGYDSSFGLEFSTDGGSTWVQAKPQPTVKELISDHYASYWTPVPEGTTTVEFRGGTDDWSVRDITIWAPA